MPKFTVEAIFEIEDVSQESAWGYLNAVLVRVPIINGKLLEVCEPMEVNDD